MRRDKFKREVSVTNALQEHANVIKLRDVLKNPSAGTYTIVS